MLLEMNVSLRRGNFDLTTHLAVSEASTGLFGTSGAGKSTLLGLIAGTLQPESGRIVLDGKTLFDSQKGIIVPREQRPIGSVLQQDSIQGGATVKDSLRAVYDRTLKQRRLFKPGRLVGLLELEGVLSQRADQLSAGERQRVALACALLKSPRLLLLDEPFAPLGHACKTHLLPLLRRVSDEFGLPLLYASHSLGEILELTNQLIVLANGRVLRNGIFRDLAREESLRGYLGVRQIENVLSVTIHSHDAEAGCTFAKTYGTELALPLRPQLPVDSEVQLSIRSCDIALSRHYLTGISIQNQLKGRICALVPMGESVLVQIDCGSTLLAGITPRACQDMDLHEGDTVYCLAKTHSFCYLAESETAAVQRLLRFAEAMPPGQAAGPLEPSGFDDLAAADAWHCPDSTRH
jgi:molybdate transport system ATP-binding protein